MSQLAVVQQFIDLSREASSPTGLQELIADTTREIGFDFFALVHHIDLSRLDIQSGRTIGGSAVVITNYPENWVAEYVARNIAPNDPVHLASHRTNVGFRWDEMGDLITITAEHRAIRADALRAGLDQGFTVPANVPGEANGSCSFAMRAGRDLPRDNLPIAQLIGAYAFHAARRMALHATDRSSTQDHPHLTPRQLECLLLVARGKNDSEIANMLNISRETVKAHLKEARAAYSAPKRIQAVLRAVSYGHLDIRDILVR